MRKQVQNKPEALRQMKNTPPTLPRNRLSARGSEKNSDKKSSRLKKRSGRSLAKKRNRKSEKKKRQRKSAKKNEMLGGANEKRRNASGPESESSDVTVGAATEVVLGTMTGTMTGTEAAGGIEIGVGIRVVPETKIVRGITATVSALETGAGTGVALATATADDLGKGLDTEIEIETEGVIVTTNAIESATEIGTGRRIKRETERGTKIRVRIKGTKIRVRIETEKGKEKDGRRIKRASLAEPPRRCPKKNRIGSRRWHLQVSSGRARRSTNSSLS